MAVNAIIVGLLHSGCVAGLQVATHTTLYKDLLFVALISMRVMTAHTGKVTLQETFALLQGLHLHTMRIWIRGRPGVIHIVLRERIAGFKGKNGTECYRVAGVAGGTKI